MVWDVLLMASGKCRLCGTEIGSAMGNPYLCSWCEGSYEREYPDNRGYGVLMAVC